MKFSTTLNTSGSGLWSQEKREVVITKIEFYGLGEHSVNCDDFGELRVYFTKRSWNIDKHGLIYTDPKFLRELRAELKRVQPAGSDVDYSEQGMQGFNYVSLDVGKSFIKSWNRLTDNR